MASSPPTEAPAPAPGTRRTPKTQINEGDMVTVVCGCVGEVITGGVHLTGQYPYVSINVKVPHTRAHPEHLPLVSPGVIQHFAPQLVRPYTGPSKLIVRDPYTGSDQIL